MTDSNPRPSRRLPALLTLACLLLGAGVLTQCAGAEGAACRNDGACRERGGKFRYCYRSKCVECVSSASCGYDFMCVRGECEVK
jgi:hypothetical protein